MHAEVISIGNEILRGAVVNSNAAFISHHLAIQGWDVRRHHVVPDRIDILLLTLKEALKNTDLVITTGGLGPTLDDVTREAVVELLNDRMVFNSKVALDLEKRYGEKLLSLDNQATIPSQAHVLLNSIGTAPGLVFQIEEKVLICLPGVSLEMQTLLVNQVLPYLKKKFSFHKKMKTQMMHFCDVNESMLNQFFKLHAKKCLGMEIGLYPSYGTVSVFLRSEDKKQCDQLKMLLKKNFRTHIFDSKEGKIEEAIHTWMTAHKKTLVLAESCTGGSMAARLTHLAGASKYFLGSFVTYSDDLKKKALKVSGRVLDRDSSVSEEAVKEMVRGILKISGADYGIAVSGIAGPTGGTAKKPVGTVWAAFQEKGKKPFTFKLQLQGNREKIINSATTKIFSAFYRRIQFG